MKSDRLDVIVHPVRSRIMVALMGRAMTTTQLSEVLPDVPVPTLYRHVRKLAEAGVVEVVSETLGRGATERAYGVVQGGGELTRESLMTKDAQVRAFTMYLATMGATFQSFVNHPRFDPKRDIASSMAEALLLSDDEYRELLDKLYQTIDLYRARSPAPGRRRRVLSMIAIPEEPA